MGRYQKKVVVVIPVHSETLSHFEKISLKQCFNILGNHPIKLLAPKGLDVSEYQKVVPSFDVEFIDPKWQASIQGYNKLKLSKFFYELFSDYEFLLTYELDAFVFKDELIHWCNKGYDYIGAPWFKGYSNPTSEFLGVGNSGFSLRNVKAMKRTIGRVCIEEGLNFYFGKKNSVSRKISIILNKLLIRFGENHTIQNSMHLNEDAFIAQVIGVRVKNFKIASIKEAIPFSFETKPRFLYKTNKNKLPMGCHAWWTYDFDFWKPFIECFGFKIIKTDES